MGNEANNRFYWSRKRDGVFRACLRQYYFEYYGGLSTARVGAREREMGVLRRLQTRAAWIQRQILRSIRLLLETAAPLPAPEAASHDLLTALRTDFRDSRSGAYRQAGAAARGLFEHEYNLQIPDAAWKEATDHAAAMLTRFLQSDLLKQLLSLPPESRRSAPETGEFILDGLPVRCQPGLMVQRNGCVELIQWRADPSWQPDEIDASCRALYACHKESTTPDRLRLIDVRLAADGAETAAQPGDQALEFAREYIHDSADEMQFPLDGAEEGAPPAEDLFDLTDDEAACRTCNYLKICPRWA